MAARFVVVVGPSGRVGLVVVVVVDVLVVAVV